jgi:hypothetical protein
MPTRKGRKSAAQTPAPKSDRIYGSKTNKAGSASSKKSASSIVLSDKVVQTLKDKADKYNETHSNKVSVNTLKAVFRRGSGAYSKSHRPTITGGAPNSRNAWSFARVNKFLEKKSGKPVKKAYVQDDDLMAKGGILKSDSFKNWFKSSKVVDSKGNPKVMYHGTRYDFTEFKENIGKNTHHSSRHLGFFFTDYRVAQWFANPTWDDNEISMKDEYKKIRNKQLGVDKLKKELSMTSGFNYDKYEKLNSQIYNKETRIDNEWEKITYYRKRLDFGYGANVMPVYLCIQNPKEMSFNEVYSIGGGLNEDYEKVEEKAKKLKQNLISKGYDGIKILPNDDNEEAEFEQYVAFYPNQIKSAIGNVGSFDPNNPDIRYKKGGTTFNDKDLLAKWKKGESIGFTGEAHLKAKGLIPRADGKKVKSEKYMENGGFIAPNGKKSNLTPEQYKLVRTPEFKAWFGDWENDPENASKVVDENGEPLVVYHGTYAKEKFNNFDFSKADLGFHFGTYEQAKDRSFTKFAVKDHKQFIEPFFLNIRELFIIEDAIEFQYPQSYIGDLVEKRILTNGEVIENSLKGLETKQSNEVVRNILVEKYKKVGFKYDNKLEGKGYSYIVCEPNQIKLADSTNTKFDANNLDITFEDGGLNQDVVCVNCGWAWNTADSDESDKYVCHKCGFDNTLYYSNDIISKLKEPKTLSEIAEIHGVGLAELEAQLQKGIKEESEHTTDSKVAETIALHHLEEKPDYYDVLEKAMNPKKIALPDTYSTFEGLKPILENQGYDLVEINDKPANGTFEEEFKEGGVVVGKRHSEEDENGTGERFLVESTGQMVEVEGGEGVLCKESMSSDKLYDFEGKKQTGRQIASFLNHKYGGVEFAEGGEVGHVCGCRSKKYYHGGELPSATLQGLSGGEAVVTVKTMESKDLYSFEGRKMTPRQILSKINADSGGKKFEEGGTIDLTKNTLEKHNKLTKMVYFTENILYS